MEIRHELTYDAPPDDVRAMLADPAFRVKVCEAMDVSGQEVSIDPAEATPESDLRVRIDMLQRTQGLPAFARRIVGERTRVVQSEHWSGREADLRVEIPGRPGEIRGRISLSPTGAGTTESFEGRATLKVPLVGGRLEGLIHKLFIAGMDTEQAVGRRWLAGERR
jgi:hypothetical protein